MTDKSRLQTSSSIPLLDDQLVDMIFITNLTGMTDKYFYKQVQLGSFAKPIKIGRSSRWLKSEVEQWLNKKIVASRS